ncbi:TPA: restriction endonuclease subunit S [Streptococcus suis]|nr:restriction endonuclease subunit S [Streptococcus suis]HEM5036368.1 restriction endonuclease subunit S [Streptococcus suis]HEM5112426.1 restriction endonuclease subunit S [Streptococcus suis]HEM5672191.1 restriction endonuclease subunit S [Streptococcus suis]
MSEVVRYKFSEFATITSSKRVHLSDYVEVGVPFYRSKEIIELANNQGISETLFISEAKYNEIKNKYPVPQIDDILITAVGTIGKIYLVKDVGFYFKDGNLIWVRDVNKEIININYLYYFLNSPVFQSNIIKNNIGAVQKAITIDHLKSIELDLPTLEAQNNISNILKNIDQKIALNNQINEELEAMAKTLYDHWFVQFDFPDENGKPYKSSGGKMVYNDQLKREIPEGWGVDSLWNIATFYNGLAMQKFRPASETDESLPVIKIREMFSGFSKDTEKASTAIPKEAIIEAGDILFSWSATLEVILWGGEKGALNQHIFKVTSEKYPKSFIYNELRSYLKVFKTIAELRKTTMGHITQEHLKQAMIIIPPNDLIDEIHNRISLILKQQLDLKQQNQELTQLRDWLLPMLMNGQVKV